MWGKKTFNSNNSLKFSNNKTTLHLCQSPDWPNDTFCKGCLCFCSLSLHSHFHKCVFLTQTDYVSHQLLFLDCSSLIGNLTVNPDLTSWLDKTYIHTNQCMPRGGTIAQCVGQLSSHSRVSGSIPSPVGLHVDLSLDKTLMPSPLAPHRGSISRKNFPRVSIKYQLYLKLGHRVILNWVIYRVVICFSFIILDFF